MAIEYLRGGIFLYTGDEAHFDSLVNQGFYSPVPAHEIPYDLRLEIQERLDARGIKGSSARQSTGTNEAGKNCWAPNKPCGKACRVNCKSDKAATGAGAATKTKKSAAKKQVSEALAKKKGRKISPRAPKNLKESGQVLNQMVLGRTPSPKDGPPPPMKVAKTISKKDYANEEESYIAAVEMGQYGHGKGSKKRANELRNMDPKTRRAEIGENVRGRIMNRRIKAAEQKRVPALLKHHDITPEEHLAGVNHVHMIMADTPEGKEKGYMEMTDEQKLKKFGANGIIAVLSARESVANRQANARGQQAQRGKDVAERKRKRAETAAMGEALMRDIDAAQDAPPLDQGPGALDDFIGQESGKTTRAKKARKPRGAKREKADSRYDSWDFVPYYAQTGLPCLVDPFHAFR